jgi:hypothetical protein
VFVSFKFRQYRLFNTHQGTSKSEEFSSTKSVHATFTGLGNFKHNCYASFTYGFQLPTSQNSNYSTPKGIRIKWHISIAASDNFRQQYTDVLRFVYIWWCPFSPHQTEFLVLDWRASCAAVWTANGVLPCISTLDYSLRFISICTTHCTSINMPLGYDYWSCIHLHISTEKYDFPSQSKRPNPSSRPCNSIPIYVQDCLQTKWIKGMIWMAMNS